MLRLFAMSDDSKAIVSSNFQKSGGSGELRKGEAGMRQGFVVESCGCLFTAGEIASAR